MASNFDVKLPQNGYCRDVHSPDFMKQQANDRSVIDAGLYRAPDTSSKKQSKAERALRS